MYTIDVSMAQRLLTMTASSSPTLPRSERAERLLIENAVPFVVAFQSFCSAGATQEEDRRWCGLGANLIKDWAAVFRFVVEDGVDPTNNTGEQRLRQAVLWRRSSQGSRSDNGSAFVARMLTVGTTCRIQARSLVAFVTDAVSGALLGRPSPSLLGSPSG